MIIKHDGKTLVETGQPHIDLDDEFSVNLISLGLSDRSQTTWEVRLHNTEIKWMIDRLLHCRVNP